MTVSLSQLLREAGVPYPPHIRADIDITTVAYDSRTAVPGCVFVAIPGLHVDGHAFALDAVQRGAKVVIAERIPNPPLLATVPLIIVDNARAVLAQLAATISGHPSQSLTVAGVTGTDGKSTTTTMLWAAWRGAQRGAGCLTTIDFRVLDAITPNTTRQTTLEAVELQARLRAMADAGCTHVALETSSHALVRHRVDALTFRAAVYTKITSEHLEVHGTREEYLAAKARLAQRVAQEPDGVVVLDRDDDFAFPVLEKISVPHRLTYSVASPNADLYATDIVADDRGVRFTAHTPWGVSPVALKLAGRFNVSNALAALAAACATGASFDGAVSGIEKLDGVNGRMERIDLGQPFSMVVDYAHTAESLETILRELRVATRGKLWVVFGSAGERDTEKRPAMGAVAAHLADYTVITDEDPRDEDRLSILNEIAAGATGAGGRIDDTVFLIADRREAIQFAVDRAASGDTIVCAGKGHESCILMSGSRTLPWNERSVAEVAIRQRLATKQ